jgi:hypothetical protein
VRGNRFVQNCARDGGLRECSLSRAPGSSAITDGLSEPGSSEFIRPANAGDGNDDDA